MNTVPIRRLVIYDGKASATSHLRNDMYNCNAANAIKPKSCQQWISNQKPSQSFYFRWEDTFRAVFITKLGFSSRPKYSRHPSDSDYKKWLGHSPKRCVLCNWYSQYYDCNTWKETNNTICFVSQWCFFWWALGRGSDEIGSKYVWVAAVT